MRSDITIRTGRGDVYTVDLAEDRVLLNGKVTPNLYPVFTGNGKEESSPLFAGILNDNDASIITINGRRKKIVDINSIR